MSGWKDTAIPVADWKSSATPVEPPDASEQGWAPHPGLLGALIPMEQRDVEDAGRGPGSILDNKHEFRPAIPAVIKAIPGMPKAILNSAVEAGEGALGKRELTPQMVVDSLSMIAGGPAAATATKTAAPVVRAGVKEAADVAGDVARALPSPKDVARSSVKQASQNSFKIMDDSGIRVSPESFQSFADGLQSKLTGFNAKLKSRSPETHALLNDLRNYANEEDTLSFKELADLRSQIGDAAFTATKNDKRLIHEIRDNIEEYMDGLSEADLDTTHTKGDIDVVNSALNKGKDLWRKNALMEDIEKIGKVSKNKEYGKDVAYIQRKFSQIVEKPERLESFTPKQQEVIKKIANTGSGEKVARFFAPAGGLGGILHGGAGYLAGLALTGGNPFTAAAVPAAALVTKGAYNAARKSRMSELQNMIATGDRGSPSFIQRIAAERALRRAVQGQP